MRDRRPRKPSLQSEPIRVKSLYMTTAAIEVSTTDQAWAEKHATPAAEGRYTVPGCSITRRYQFCGRDWVNYTLPAGVPIPAGWNVAKSAAQSGVLAAPAIWVHETVSA